MSNDDRSKLTLKGVTLLVLILCLFFFSRDSTKALLAPVQEQKSSPTISISKQDDSPLRVISTEVVSAEKQNFRIRAIVQNQSSKEIRAYAIASDVMTSKTQSGHVQFMNLTQPGEIWQPSQIKTIEVNDASDEPIINVKLTIDFVEHSDGTTYGPDTHKSSDILAGQRAGARGELQRLRQLLKDKGQQVVMDDVHKPVSSDLKSPGGATHSSQWLEGFRSGVSAVRGRIKRAGQLSSIKASSELDKPFDTALENPK
jgi:hypothetical protein